MSTRTGGGEDGLEGGALVPPDSSLRPSDLDSALPMRWFLKGELFQLRFLDF